MRSPTCCNGSPVIAFQPNNDAHYDGLTQLQYKDAVVIGNGPSGITLSFLLSGHWPYYSANQGLEHPVDFLHERLKNSDTSLVLQDLQFLAQGLEGRSGNPVALLFDALNHPEADRGQELPSMLQWKFHPEYAIDHVVLGRGPRGGSWQAMDGNVLTISLGAWMELPGLRYREWEEIAATREHRHVGTREKRASVASVAQYYSDYVQLQDLSHYFRSFCTVKAVRRLSPEEIQVLLDCGSGTVDNLKLHKAVEETDGKLWRVEGVTFNGTNEENFCYVTPNVVLATGGFDLPNSLGVPGEDLPFVVKSLQAMEDLINQGKVNANSDPVLIVGAGLSAADAIIATHFRNIPIVHCYRRSTNDPNMIFRQLPSNMYPEYHKVYQMMKDNGLSYSGYKPLEHHRVVRILPDGKVCLQGPQTCCFVKVSYVVVLIGSKPNLSFLQNSGADLLVHKDKPISCRSNPIDVDLYTMESVYEPGLYAMGPLVADNFVRFGQGGALAITQSIHRKLSRWKVDSAAAVSSSTFFGTL